VDWNYPLPTWTGAVLPLVPTYVIVHRLLAKPHAPVEAHEPNAAHSTEKDPTAAQAANRGLIAPRKADTPYSSNRLTNILSSGE
jgi:hypothetical protein